MHFWSSQSPTPVSPSSIHKPVQNCFSQRSLSKWFAGLKVNTGKFIPIYIQQDATLHSLFYLETALHVSDGTITHHQERKQLYLQHLVFVTLLLLSAAIVEEVELV